MDMTKYREMFLSETREHLNNMSRLVITLEKDPSDREGIDSLFRDVHSIKGMAASMGYAHTAELAHHLEDLMDGFRKSGTVRCEGPQARGE
jgi:two-component system chemotaxis sensor kinase CheA